MPPFAMVSGPLEGPFGPSGCCARANPELPVCRGVLLRRGRHESGQQHTSRELISARMRSPPGVWRLRV